VRQQLFLEKKSLVYVAGPYCPRNCTLHDAPRIAQQNVDHAIDVGIRLIKMGYVVFIPHFSHYIHLKMKEDMGSKWVDFDLAILDRCDAICLIKGWQNSPGALREKKRAEGKRMFIFTEEQIEELR